MIKYKLILCLIVTAFIFPSNTKAQINLDKYINHPWVDSVFNLLTPDERIAQLIWIDVNSGEDIQKQFTVSNLIHKYNFGGVIFFGGKAVRQAELTNHYQSLSKIPLIVAMDAEWGAGMRLEDVEPFPYNLTLGAVTDDQLIRNCARAMATQLKRLGVQVSLGPVADINSEPLNPIIGIRSFGESRYQVALKSSAFMKGLQENGIIAVAKHFPGHGDTKSDSHVTLPVLPFSRQRLDSVELYPFKKLAAEGIGGIMTAHLRVPALDPTGESPSSLSKNVIHGILRKDWNYKGLILTDAMNMGGVTGFDRPGKTDVQALIAGNDVIEFPLDPEITLRSIKEAILNNEIKFEEINLKCRRVLAAKYISGLNHRKQLKLEGLLEDLNSSAIQFAKQQITESSLTLIENKNQLIPFLRLDTLRIAALSVGSFSKTPFQNMLSNYSKVDFFNLRDDFTEEESLELIKKLSSYNLVITGVHSLWECRNRRTFTGNKPIPGSPEVPYGLTRNLNNLISKISDLKNSVLVYFANPFAINEIKDLGHPSGILIAYQNSVMAQEKAAQLLFGGIPIRGKLPVSLGNHYDKGYGLTTDHSIRLKYTIPEEVGLNSVKFNRSVDSIVENALVQKAFPGCNILIAKDGRIIFQKAYGFHTYEERVPSKLDDLYDLASVTKVAGALPAIMKLNEEGKYILDEKFSTYWKDWRKGLFHPSNKSNLTVRELLAHQAGLVPYMPFWKESMNGNTLSHKWYNAGMTEQFESEVAPGMYLNSRFKNKVYRAIRKSPLETRGKYVYSCLSFIIAPEVITKLSGMKYTDYLDKNFYRPLGATTVTYQPSRKFSDDQIVPTEYDAIFRKRLVHSSVHDEASAVLGGISGNAGLFASANDLAKIVQMYVQFGTYGGKEYLKHSTIEEFNRVQYPQNNNRRALGFDKPLIDNQKFNRENSYPCPAVSPESFGHSGFTGTFFWADPKNGLIYIFLSNRVNPTRENNKLSDLNVRTEILQTVYEQLNKLKIN